MPCHDAKRWGVTQNKQGPSRWKFCRQSRTIWRRCAGLSNAKAGVSSGVVQPIYTDGLQPVGRGIGPALEARDVLAVLRGTAGAPLDLRERALQLAGALLEFCSAAPEGGGYAISAKLLDSGQALAKFLAICDAQGGFREPSHARHTHVVLAQRAGRTGHQPGNIQDGT